MVEVVQRGSSHWHENGETSFGDGSKVHGGTVWMCKKVVCASNWMTLEGWRREICCLVKGERVSVRGSFGDAVTRSRLLTCWRKSEGLRMMITDPRLYVLHGGDEVFLRWFWFIVVVVVTVYTVLNEKGDKVMGLCYRIGELWWCWIKKSVLVWRRV